MNFFYKLSFLGDWGLGMGDWGLGIGPNPQSPIPNPPIPNPQLLFFMKKKRIKINIIEFIIKIDIK